MSAIDRAAIMAQPPQQQPASGTVMGFQLITLDKIPNLILMGGIMYAGGKLAEYVWGMISEHGGSLKDAVMDNVRSMTKIGPTRDDEPPDEDYDDSEAEPEPDEEEEPDEE